MTGKPTELGDLVANLVDRYLFELDAVIVERDDAAGRVVAEIPDAATVEYQLTIRP